MVGEPCIRQTDIWRTVIGKMTLGEMLLDESMFYFPKADCLYVPMSLFCSQTARQTSTKFCTDLHTNSGKIPYTSMTLPTRPPDPRVPQTSKLLPISGEKPLPYKNVQMGDLVSFNFSRAAAGPGLAGIYIRV